MIILQRHNRLSLMCRAQPPKRDPLTTIQQAYILRERTMHFMLKIRIFLSL